MQLSDLIAPDAVSCDLRPNSKKQFLQQAAERIASGMSLDARLVFETLLQRERLGSTGIGNGVAIPHGKLPGIEAISAFVFRTARPIDFDSMDDEPADLFFVLLAPEGSGADHLKALSRIARVMREPNMLEKLRAAPTAGALHTLLTSDLRRPVSSPTAHLRHAHA